MSNRIPDPEQAYENLLSQLSADLTPGVGPAPGRVMLVGIHTGGAWVARRLVTDLARQLKSEPELGFLSSAFHRDDYAKRGLPGEMKSTQLPLSIDDARIILIDDILFTGRTVRAALNDLFDYGRPDSVELGVLIDRGGRQLPVQPDFCGAVHQLQANENFSLTQGQSGQFSLDVK